MDAARPSLQSVGLFVCGGGLVGVGKWGVGVK